MSESKEIIIHELAKYYDFDCLFEAAIQKALDGYIQEIINEERRISLVELKKMIYVLLCTMKYLPKSAEENLMPHEFRRYTCDYIKVAGHELTKQELIEQNCNYDYWTSKGKVIVINDFIETLRKLLYAKARIVIKDLFLDFFIISKARRVKVKEFRLHLDDEEENSWKICARLTNLMLRAMTKNRIFY